MISRFVKACWVVGLGSSAVMPVALVYLRRYVYCVFVYVQYVQHVRRMNDAVVFRCTGCSHK